MKTLFIILLILPIYMYGQPANDKICDAIEIPVDGSSTTGNNINATDSWNEGVSDPTCANYDWTGNYFDVWYYALIPDNGILIVETSQANMFPRISDTGLNLYYGISCSDICSIKCDDDGSGKYSKITINNGYPGDTVWIRVWDYGCDDEGYFNISASTTSEPKLTASSNGDCRTASTVCSDANITSNSTGKGNFNELNCSNHGELLGNEHYSTWLFFHTQTSGTLEFTIHPNNEDGGTNDDYDFAIWIGTECNPNSKPIRSSWAVSGDQSSYSGCSNRDIGYDTGLNDANASSGDGLDTQEGQCGDGWLKSISANAGDEFTLLIDNYSSTTNSFTLTWSLSGGATLNCSTLPVDYNPFTYNCITQEMKWQTLSEVNNDYFLIEVGNKFDNYGNLVPDNIYTVSGNGNTNYISNYSLTINIKNQYINLYQIDYNGNKTLLETKYIYCTSENEKNLKLIPNPALQNSVITIDGNYNKIKIYNILGEKIQVNIQDNKIYGLSTGIYLVKIDNKEPVKLIVK